MIPQFEREPTLTGFLSANPFKAWTSFVIVALIKTPCTPTLGT